MLKKKIKQRVGRPRETFIDKQIVAVIRMLFACSHAPVPTPAIAETLVYSAVYIRERLRSLETRGIVTRVSERGGWILPLSPK